MPSPSPPPAWVPPPAIRLLNRQTRRRMTVGVLFIIAAVVAAANGWLALVLDVILLLVGLYVLVTAARLARRVQQIASHPTTIRTMRLWVSHDEGTEKHGPEDTAILAAA